MRVEHKGIFAEVLEVAGIKPAITSMRNPMNSWHLSDSGFAFSHEGEDMVYVIGDKDLDLAQRLIKAGTEHCKFLRQISVWLDLNLPRYVWSEFDTYHFNTKNSCSTMHKLFAKNKTLSKDDFYVEYPEMLMVLNPTIEMLNEIGEKYLENKDMKYLRMAKSLLPESFLQRRTVSTNYAELRTIYHQRKNHRLDSEWGVVIKAIESLPCAKELIML